MAPERETTPAPCDAGILAVWNDRDERIAGAYEQWYVKEHLPERVAAPGWRFGRRYEGLAPRASYATPRFFTYYGLDVPAAAFSPDYLARLNAPTPGTVEIMTHWRNMSRTVCRLRTRHGQVSGAFTAVARFAPSAQPVLDRLEAIGMALVVGSGALSMQVWEAVAMPPASGLDGDVETVEARVRGVPDAHIGAALLVDAQREVDCLGLSEDLRRALTAASVQAVGVGSYRLLCQYG